MSFCYVLLIFNATHKLDVDSCFCLLSDYVSFSPAWSIYRWRKCQELNPLLRVFIELKPVADYVETKNKESPLVGLSSSCVVFGVVSPDCHTCRPLVLNFPSASPTSLSCAHLRVSASPALFVKRWTSLAVWRPVSSTFKEWGQRRRDNSFTLRTKRTGNHPGERNSRAKGVVGGEGGCQRKMSIHPHKEVRISLLVHACSEASRVTL